SVEGHDHGRAIELTGHRRRLVEQRPMAAVHAVESPDRDHRAARQAREGGALVDDLHNSNGSGAPSRLRTRGSPPAAPGSPAPSRASLACHITIWLPHGSRNEAW